MSDVPAQPSAPEGHRARWGVGRVLLGVVFAIAFSALGLFAVAIFDPELESSAARIAAQATLAVALVFAASLAAGQGPERAGAAELGLRRPSRPVVGASVLAYLVYIGAAIALAPLLAPEQEDIARELGLDETVLSSVAAGIAIVVLAPVAEEIFFRGFVFAGLATRMPWFIAAFLSAAVWAVIHLPQGSLGVVVMLTIFGFVLAWLYRRTGSLWPAIVVHAFNNGLAFALNAGL